MPQPARLHFPPLVTIVGTAVGRAHAGNVMADESFVPAPASPERMAPDPERHQSDDQEIARDLEPDGLGHEGGEQVQPAMERVGGTLEQGGVMTIHERHVNRECLTIPLRNLKLFS